MVPPPQILPQKGQNLAVSGMGLPHFEQNIFFLLYPHLIMTVFP
jgi:hypothetical protein